MQHHRKKKCGHMRNLLLKCSQFLVIYNIILDCVERRSSAMETLDKKVSKLEVDLPTEFQRGAKALRVVVCTREKYPRKA